MPSRFYTIQMKQDKVRVLAKNRDCAFAKFFKDVIDQKIPLDKLGNIVMLKDGKKDYPFRTVPLLYQLKLMSGNDAVSNIMAVTGVEKKEAEDMLMKMSFADGKLIPLIEKLRREENQ